MDEADIDRVYADEIQPKTQELEALRRDLRVRLREFAGAIVIACAMLGAFIAIGGGNAGWSIAVPFTLMVMGCIWAFSGVRKEFTERAKAIVHPAIATTLGARVLDRDAGDATVKAAQDAGAILDGRREIDDGFQGTYRSCDFDLVEATVIRGSGKSQTIPFRGLLLSLSVPVAFTSRIVIAKDGGAIGNAVSNFLAERFKAVRHVHFPDDPAFEAAFEVRAEDEEEARRLLAPGLRKTLVGFQTQYGRGKVRAAFHDTRFYLAIMEAKNRFEPVSFNRPVTDLRAGTMEVARDLALSRELIDRLFGD